MFLNLLPEDFLAVEPLIKAHDYYGFIDFMSERKHAYEDAECGLKAGYYYKMGIAYSKIGKYQKADEHFDASLRIAPNHHRILLERADSYLRRGELKKGGLLLADLEEEIRNRKGANYRRLRFLMGRCYKLFGQYDIAKQCFEEIAPLDAKGKPSSKDIDLMDEFIKNSEVRPDPARGLMEFANHLFKNEEKSARKSELASIFLKNCLSNIQSTEIRVQCYASLSQFYMEQKRYDEAFESTQHALDLDNTHMRSLAARIRLLFMMGRHNEAMAHYETDKDILCFDVRASLAVAKTFKHVGMHHIAYEIASFLADSDHQIDPDILESAQIIQATTPRLSRNLG